MTAGRGDIMRGLSMAMTLQNVTESGGTGGTSSSVFFPAVKYYVQNNANSPSIVINPNGTSYLTKAGVWAAYYCFGTPIPKTAKKIILHMRIVDISNPYDHQVVVCHRPDYAVDTSWVWTEGRIAHITNGKMSVEELMNQERIISLSLSSNVSMSEQDVVMDVSHIKSDFYVNIRTGNQTIYLYSISYE